MYRMAEEDNKVLDLLTKALPFLLILSKNEDPVDIVRSLLLVGLIFLVISVIKADKWKWRLAAFMIFLRS